MLAEFKTKDGVIRVSAGANTNQVFLTIDRMTQDPPFTLHLPPTLGRAIASCLMGASAEAAQRKSDNG